MITSLKKFLVLVLISGVPLSAGEWQALFDGQTLQGWTFDVLDNSDPATIFSVREGVIDIKGAGESTAVMRTTKSFGDFELTFEWRWPGVPGNSGCLLFCSTPRSRNIWPKSLEVQLESGNAGDFITIGEDVTIPESQRLKVIPEKESWKVRLRPKHTDGAERPAGEWNHMRIVVKDRVVTAEVNGVVVNRGTDATASSGQICLQSERADVQYRYVRIKPE
jgi:hypothetical protein